MADSKEILIEIKTNMADSLETLVRLQKQLDAVKVEQMKVEAAFKSGQKSREDADKELQALAATQRSLSSDMKSVKKEIDNQTKAYKLNEGSIQQMRAQLANMRKEYEEMSKAERNSAKGDELLLKIRSTTDDLKKLEAAQGDYRRSVGQYQNAIKNLSPVLSEVFGKFAELSKGTMNVGVAFKNGITQVKAFGAQLLKLLANPIVAIIAAIAAVVMKLVDSFKKNDEAVTELNAAFAAFKPVLDVIEKGFQKLVGVVTNVVSAIGKVVKGVMSAIPGMKEYADAEEDIVRSTDALEESERQYSENHEQREAEIAELREKAVDSENYTFKQRKEFLEKAGKLEQDDLKDRKTVAAEKVRIAEKQALLEIGEVEMTAEAWEKLTDEQKDHITELRNELAQADKDYSTAARKLKKEQNSLDSQEESERKQRAREAAAAAKDRRQKEKEALNAVEDLYIKTIINIREREYALTEVQGEREIEALKERLATEKNLTEKAKKALNEQIILMEADLRIKLANMQSDFNYDLQKQTQELVKRQQEWILKSTDNNDLMLNAKLFINTIDTNSVKGAIEKEITGLQSELASVASVEKDLHEFMFGELDEDEILMKYQTVFELNGINKGNTLANLEEYFNKVNTSVHDQLSILQDTLKQIDIADKKETERIITEHTKKLHDEERTRLDLTRKHAEIMRAIELESGYDAYGQNEVEKTRILLEQAKERQRIAEEEYAYISAERKKYTDQELISIYGSLEGYNNAVLEANLKVIESENDVKDAMRDVANASTQQKITMIENATAIMGSINSILGSMQGLFETMAESNESYADFATAMALMQILVSTAISIANAIQGATAAGAATGIAAPLTTPVFITEMIAIVAGAMVSATTTLMKAQQAKKSAPKFAEGGLVGRRYAQTREEGRRDDVQINASLGEYIINADAVKRYGVAFLDSINGHKALPVATHYADGGIIGGRYAQTREEGRRDDVPVNASIGEYIINADAVKRYGVAFFDSINGHKALPVATHYADGGYISQMTAAAGNMQMQIGMMSSIIAESVENIQPVVSVREITKAQNRVKTAESISRK